MSETILERIQADLTARQQKGVETYQTTLDNAGLNHHALLGHGYEEVLDLAMYLKALGDALYRHDFYLRLAEDAAVWLEYEGYKLNDANGWWEHTENKARVLRPADAVRLYEVHQAGRGYSDQFERVSNQSAKNA